MGLVRGDVVGGVAFASSVGPVGLHGEATVTSPAEEAAEDDPFVRAVLGEGPGAGVELELELAARRPGEIDLPQDRWRQNGRQLWR